MARKNGGNTKKDSGRRIRRQTEGTAIAPRLGQRPGRSPANREINLRLRRSQRLQSARPQLFPAPPHMGEVAAAEGYSAQSQGEQTAASTSSPDTSAQMSSAAHEPSRARKPIPPDWRPPLAIGESLGDNLSRLEEAERSVLQWEAIVENARITQPLADLSGLEQQLHKARQRFSQMEDTDENLIPVDELETTKRQRIQQRIGLLKASLERSECPVGDTNIRSAIRAYQSGRIKCWDKWTLLYAGNVVDFCPSYESFTLDRDERLDRYHSMYGDGWLWYEAPLAPNGNYQPEQLMAATWAQPSGSCSALTDYHSHAWSIHMGFQRVKGFHSRFISRLNDPSPMDTGKVLPYETRMREHGSPGRGTCFVEDDSTAPRVCFHMQLDSGATHLSLHKTDMAYLAIDRKTYPAQTHTTVATANSTTVAALYEIRVDICRHNGESLVGEEPVFPNARRQIGGIVPVMVLVESTADQSEPLAEWYKEALKNGEDVSEEAMAARYKGQDESRLSGMLPFQVCYFSGAPGAPTFWFGEDRRDVLGADRMPGHQRWERHKKAYIVKRPAEFEDLDRPTVIFEHKGNGIRLVDMDSKEDKGTSILSVERQVTLKAGETPQKKTLPGKGSSSKSGSTKRKRRQQSWLGR
ncbi:hypothetical protein FOXG_11229 [Fusarium oxysporum f. sp. lycopersici 4287]|uniref:Uncharacterized protein n=2 Tax=Fusarium oxysporum TaxID=5507 RepID=A0A0J9WQR8_FUSO4|nr:hypothetical protein FOXG_11229 [Fusarium oxysporum f. sp. lycopersici 4287]KAJ9429443.1 hypothetical protein QL093DRAFT_2110168 [Fusarium oxysporum]KNB11257.1 hypothetical protein FOXG_11229 [Fusarium oxysporum f. sp. lycopersici 4287]